MPVLRFEGAGLAHPGRTVSEPVVALEPTDLVIDAGDTVAVIGRSGSGKTSLTDLALGLRRPTGGRILVDGQLWSDPKRWPDRRRRGLVQGVAQDAGASLPPRWTVAKALRTAARRLAPPGERPTGEDLDRAVRNAARMAQLENNLLDRRPRQLSGGQAQRAAIARALVARPLVVVADEPTSALGADMARSVAGALIDLAAATKVAVIVVTHDDAVANRCRRTLLVVDGKVREHETRSNTH
jgi:ABC-type glutathione transport system ATPase component